MVCVHQFLPTQAADGTAAGARVLQQFYEWVTSGAADDDKWRLEEVNYEGWRVAVDEGMEKEAVHVVHVGDDMVVGVPSTGDGASGWLLLRSSLHDPQMVLNVESEVDGGVRKILDTLLRFFNTLEQGELDTSGLKS